MAPTTQASLRRVGIPLATLVLLLAILAFGGIGQGPIDGSEEYFEDVAASIDAIPYKVGSWIGADLPLTEVEVQMLRPNKMLQRTYQDPLTGHRASLSIVHCTDVRDMRGHYPPVCYPAHGWTLDSSELGAVEIDGRAQDARIYVFSRSNRGVREGIRIVSFFVIPYADGVLCEMSALERAAKSPQAAGLGSVQIQVLAPTTQSTATTTAIVSKILEAVEPVIRQVEAGVK